MNDDWHVHEWLFVYGSPAEYQAYRRATPFTERPPAKCLADSFDDFNGAVHDMGAALAEAPPFSWALRLVGR
jgi:hypothetical protein